MSYFDNLLEKRGLNNCLLPLWKLKLTEEEFQELRAILEARTHIINTDDPFRPLRRECTLFFAEFWRRLFVEGNHSIQMVYDALRSTRPSVNLSQEFYDAAKKGAEILQIETYDGGRIDPLNDMLYQGGLPMKLVTGNDSNSVWDRFTRGLVNKRINFEELNLGVVASRSQSMREYCNQLIVGVEADRTAFMPFFCNDEKDPWFLYLKDLAKQEKIRRRQLRPFSLQWEFEVDTVEKRIFTSYIAKGLQQLPQAFLEEQQLNDVNFFSVQIRNNGQAVDTFDYANNYCRYPVYSKHTYRDGDFISICFDNQKDAHISDYLDMSVPHLLFRNADDMYELGNQMGTQESIIIIPEGWNTETVVDFPIAEYTWGTSKLRCLRIPADFKETIVLSGEEGSIKFGANSPLYWTEMQSHPLTIPDVLESVYDANKCIYNLCYDSEDGSEATRRNVRVQYRNKWENQWTDNPSYGEIFARGVDESGNYVTPMSFINIGDGLAISLKHADRNSCQIKVVWPHGHVSTNEGERKIDDVWEVKKENCHDPRRIRFTLTPDGNGNNHFDITIKAPFKDFSIRDINGDDIDNDCWIPYSDIDKYQYHLVGQNIREYTYGNIKRELRWNEEQLYIVENGRNVRPIPYEGSLLTLFDSREVLRSLLDRTSRDMIGAVINVQLTLPSGQRMTFGIKDSPFRPRQIENGRVVITGNNRIQIKYTGTLKLLKLDDPSTDAIPMSYNEDYGCYILPEEISSWGKAIVIGRTRGRICPTLVDPTREMDREYRANNRETAIATIREDIRNSILGDGFWTRVIGWFYRVQEDDIPASSILDLSCTAQNYKALLCLAFQLYVKCTANDHDVLKEKLKSFSNDLAFQWYWLQPYLNGLFNHLQDFIPEDHLTSEPIKNIYITWALKQTGEDRNAYLSALGDEEAYMNNIGACLTDVMSAFMVWINELCISSMTETYGLASEGIVKDAASTIIKDPSRIFRIEMTGEDYVETNQEDIGEDAEGFFRQYSEPGKNGNEGWMHERINAVAAHFQREIDLFSADEGIRRSIIFCCKSSNQHFVISLNNKLSR